MYWQEEYTEPPYVVSNEIIDLVFNINCHSLPSDHAYPLAEALFTLLPWLEHDTESGIHRIKGTVSKNNPAQADDPATEVLFLSRRSKLILRLPNNKLSDAYKLAGSTLDIQGHSLSIGNAIIRPLSTQTTLYARYVIDPYGDESELVDNVVSDLQHMDIAVKKLICGKSSNLNTPDKQILTRGVMLAELDIESAVKLQQCGLGPGRKLGCGLFIPHKGIAANVTAPE